MNLRVKPISRDDVSREDAQEIDQLIEQMDHEYIPFMVSFRVTGPAEFYQVIPYTWGRDGSSEHAGFEDPIPKLTCQDGEINVISMIQDDLVEGIQFGVAWVEPDGVGLKPGAIRITLNGELEEWVWRNHFIAKLPFVNPGQWNTRKPPKPTLGPLTQPWEVQGLRWHKRVSEKWVRRKKSDEKPN